MAWAAPASSSVRKAKPRTRRGLADRANGRKSGWHRLPSTDSLASASEIGLPAHSSALVSSWSCTPRAQHGMPTRWPPIRSPTSSAALRSYNPHPQSERAPACVAPAARTELQPTHTTLPSGARTVSRRPTAMRSALAVEAEYGERLQAGPDFCHYHSGQPLRRAARHQPDARGQGEDPGRFRCRCASGTGGTAGSLAARPSRASIARCSRVLLNFAVKYGKVYPSIATIAKLACCSEQDRGARVDLVEAVRLLGVAAAAEAHDNPAGERRPTDLQRLRARALRAGCDRRRHPWTHTQRTQLPSIQITAAQSPEPTASTGPRGSRIAGAA